MINVQELRVGNWVDFTGNGGYGKVISINGEAFQDNVYLECEESFEWAEYKNLTPIPLTPEVLIAVRFMKDGFGSYNMDIEMFSCSLNQLSFSGDYLYLRQGKSDKRHEDSLVVIWNKDLMKIFYLHQLQNLYFALTGQELNYTP